MHRGVATKPKKKIRTLIRLQKQHHFKQFANSVMSLCRCLKTFAFIRYFNPDGIHCCDFSTCLSLVHLQMLSCGSLDDDSMFTGLRLKGGRVGVLSRHNCTHPPTTCNCTSSLTILPGFFSFIFRESRQLPVTIMPGIFHFFFREFRQLPVTIMPEVVQLRCKIRRFVHLPNFTVGFNCLTQPFETTCCAPMSVQKIRVFFR